MKSYIKNIKRQLKRNQDRLETYSDRKNLSKWGQEQVGYLKGMIRIQEDIIDDEEMYDKKC